MKRKEFVYEDENYDFFTSSKDDFVLDKNFKYIHTNIFYKAFSFVAYRLIMTPIAFFHTKLRYHHKVVNRKALKACKKEGYFMYGNHTLMGGDAFIPSLLAFPKDVFVVVNRANIASKWSRTFILMNGALPIPSSLKGMKNFYDAISYLIAKKKVIQIYPEAHIWPFYTKIRDYDKVSFRYPCSLGAPVYAFTNTFTKRKFSSFPKVTTYIDGPFYPDMEMELKEREEKLHSQVINAMKEKSKFSTYEVHTYKKKEGEHYD